MILIGCKKDSYDYRDKIVGKYKCDTQRHYRTINHETKDTLYIDTIIVLKTNKDEIQIMPKYISSNPNSFKINADWKFDWTEGDGIPQIHVQFFPDKDSISYYTQTGGLDGQTSYTSNGNMINPN